MTKQIKDLGLPKQALILAAGKCSRFLPFDTRHRHKSTFQMMGEAVIIQTIKSLQSLGIEEIIVVKSRDDDFIEKIVTSKMKGVSFFDQSKPLGMSNAILEVKAKLKQRFLVVNPQQINIADHLVEFSKVVKSDINQQIYLFSQQTTEPQKYGILQLDGSRVTKIVEKPLSLTGLSNQRILGIYVLNLEFLDFMANLKSSEYQLEEALDKYAQISEVFAIETKSPSLSLKYAWDLFKIASHLFLDFAPTPNISPDAFVHPTAQITGAVVIEKGAQIYENSLIQGPCYVGKNAIVGSFCKVRKESSLEEGVELQNGVEVKRSLIGAGSHIHSGFIGDSIIGENARIGAGFITANRRFDRGNIKVPIKGEMVNSQSSFLGCIIGDNVSIGIHSGTNPGTIIAENQVIMPMTMVSNPKKQN